MAGAGFGGAAATGAVFTQPGQQQEAGPGWQRVAAWGAEQARRVAPAASLALGQGGSLDPALEPSGLIAGYTGQVAIEAPGRYRFGTVAEGGTARVQVFAAGGQKLDEVVNAGAASALLTGWLELRAAPVTVWVLFARAGPARLRTPWQKDGVGEHGFAAEAIPPAAASVPRFAAREAGQWERAVQRIPAAQNAPGPNAAPR